MQNLCSINSLTSYVHTTNDPPQLLLSALNVCSIGALTGNQFLGKLLTLCEPFRAGFNTMLEVIKLVLKYLQDQTEIYN
jgi:hypothetical protein